MEKQSQSLLEQRAERIVEKGIREDKIAGACVAVLHDQEQLLFRAYGMADKERQIPMRTDSIFRMFSMTKPVTAVVTMQLLEDGLLELSFPGKNGGCGRQTRPGEPGDSHPGSAEHDFGHSVSRPVERLAKEDGRIL